MAEADNVLGISARMDISDIQPSIDKILDGLQKVGSTIQLINKLAGDNELYFATQESRQAFLELISTAQGLEKAISKTSDGKRLKSLESQLRGVQQNLADYTTAAVYGSKVMGGEFSNAISKATEELRHNQQMIMTVKAQMESLADSMKLVKPNGPQYKNLAGEYAKLEASLARYEGNVKQAQTTIDSLRAAQSAFGASSVSAGGSIDQFVRQLQQVPTVGEQASLSMKSLKNITGDLGMALIGGFGLEQLTQRIFSTRSAFQQLEISFGTMLGDAGKAKTLMGELIDTAAKTPFDMMSITNGAKQLLAYGTEANEVNEILTRLGDISAGLSIPLSDLVYLYGTTMTQGRMYTQDLRQFMGRGIPIAEELAKQFGVSENEVGELVTQGKIGAENVKKAIIDMTAEGGKFGGLMEKQSHSLSGQWSNLGDTIDQMINEIGKKTEGVFNSALSFLASIIENWQTVGKVIGTVITAVGTYKAGLMVAASIQKQQMSEGLRERMDTARDTIAKNNKSDSFFSLSKAQQSIRDKYAAQIAENIDLGDAQQQQQYDEMLRKRGEELEKQGILRQGETDRLMREREITRELERQAAKSEVNVKLQQEQNKAVAEEARKQAEIAETKKERAEQVTEPSTPSTGTRQQAKGSGSAVGRVKDAAEEQAEKNLQSAKEIYEQDAADYDLQSKKLQTLKEQAEQQKLAALTATVSTDKNGNVSFEYDAAAMERYNELSAQVAEQEKHVSDAKEKMAESNAKVTQAQEALNTAHEAGIDALSSETAETTANSTENSANSVAKDKNAVASNNSSAAQGKETVAKNAGTAANGKETVSENANTGAKTKNTLATREGTVAHRMWANTVRSATNAWRNFTIALMQNPFTAILTAITTVISLVLTFTGILDIFSSKEDEAMDGMTKAADSAATKTKTLFAEMKALDAGSQTYKDAVAELADQYKQYGIQLDETIMKVGMESEKKQELLAHELELIEAIRTEAIEREKANQIETVEKNYADKRQETWKDELDDTDLDDSQVTSVQLALEGSDTFRQEMIARTEALDAYNKSWQEATAAQRDFGVGSAEAMAAAEKQHSAYEALMQSTAKSEQALITLVQGYGKELDAADAHTAITRIMSSLADLNKEHDKEIGVIENGAKTIDGYNESLKDQAGKAKDAEEGQKQLSYWYDKTAESAKGAADGGSSFGQTITDWVDASAAKAAKDIKDMSGAVSLSTPILDATGKKVGEMAPLFDATSYAAKATAKTMDGLGLDAGKVTLGFGETATQGTLMKAVLEAVGGTAGDASAQLENMVPSTLDPKEAYPKLLQLQRDVQEKINWVNDHPTSPSVDASRLLYLNGLYNEILGKKAELEGRTPTSDRISALQEQNKLLANKTDKASIDAYARNQKEIERLQKTTAAGQYKEQKKNDKSAESARKKAQNAAKQKNKQEEQLAKERYKKAQEEARLELQLANQLEQNEIDAMEDGAAKRRRQSELDHKKRLQQIEQQRKQYLNTNIEAAATEYANKHPKGKGFYAQGLEKNVTLSDNQKQLIEAQIENENLQWADAEKKTAEELVNAHQSYTDKKLAIDKQYQEDLAAIDEAIKEARLRSDQDTVDALFRARAEATDKYASDAAKLTYQRISAGIDWKTLFSGVNKISGQMLQPMLEQLEAYTKTDEYSNADSQTQKDIASLIDEIKTYIGPDKDEDRLLDVYSLSDAMDTFSIAMDAFNKARAEEDAANKQLATAGGQLKRGEITQDEYDKIKNSASEASKATESARKDVVKFGNHLNTATDKVKNWTSGLTASLEKAGTWKSIDGFSNLTNASEGFDTAVSSLREGMASMQEGSTKQLANDLASGIEKTLGSMGEGLKSIVSTGMGQVVGFVAQIPKLILQLANAIKSLVTGILDSLTELISLRWIDDLVVSILDAVGNLINAIFDLPENLYKTLEAIVVQGVGGLLDNVLGRVGNVLSFGALSSKGPSDWFTNSNAKEVQEAIDDNTEQNNILTKSIDDLKDAIEGQKGAEAISATEQALELQRQKEENLLENANAQYGYHGHHHSFGSDWEGFTRDELARLNKQLREQGIEEWNGNLRTITAEQAKVLRSNADLWQKILDTGESDYGERYAEQLSALADEAGTVEELTQELYETLTTTTKDNIFDDALQSLYDFADGAEDAFDDIDSSWQRLVNRMAISNTIGAELQEYMSGWFDRLGELNKLYANEDIDEGEYQRRLTALKKEYDDELASMKDEVQQLRDMGIVKDVDEGEQSASAKGVSSITYDQANLLVNLGTARNMALEQGNAVRNLIQIDTTQLRLTTMQIQTDISVMRDIQEQGLTQITRIEANTRPISEILAVVNSIYKLQKENS